MPWTKNTYPPAMKNLTAAVRHKAVDIANALLEENMPEGLAIATAISRAKDWAANRHIEARTGEGTETDVKVHGQDQYVTPHEKGWAVKAEKGRAVKIFSSKKEAVKLARERAKKANAALTVQRKDGKLQQRISYNPNRKNKAKA